MNRTLKICLIALAIIAIAVIALFLGWLRNPYGLEKERLGPRGNESLPSIAPVTNAANYLLFSRYEQNTFAIHLPVPNEYFHSSNTTSRMIKTYSSSINMYYPELNGRFHPKNANLPKCNGWCGGYISAFIAAPQNDARALNARLLDQIQKDRSGENPLYRFEDMDRAFGLDDHFQIGYPAIEAKSKGNKYSTKEYLLKRDKKGNVQYLFECSPYAPSPGCNVKFNLSSRPELLVDIHFGRHLMGDWEAIIQSVDKKITSWGPVRIDAVGK